MATESWRERVERSHANRQEERKSTKRRRISPLAHYVEEVGSELAFAHYLLDEPMPSRALVKIAYRNLDRFARFVTVHTGRKGIKLTTGVLLEKPDGTTEERADVHFDWIVLA